MLVSTYTKILQMKPSKEFSKLSLLLTKTIFTAKDARSKNISSSLLAYYIKKGLIERIDRGVYRGTNSTLDVDFKWEDLVLVSKSIKGGVVCLVSALALYELTDEIPRSYWIAVSNTSRAPKRRGAKIVRMRNMTLGLTKFSLGNEVLKIFDRERTIIDAFRYLGRETAIKALKTALASRKEHKLDLKKLESYAKKLRVNITPYLLTATT